MCGIVGLVRSPNAPRSLADAARRMANAIVHRGPDDEGLYSDEHVAIGMRRLSIIDLSGGHQPIANEDETLWLVCNGEIYNFRAVRADLLERGHKFRTGSDVEVLLHLYEEYGDRFLEHVSGMFAAAIWDTRRRRLTLVRDRLGQKPLYYTEMNGSFAFASEVKSLLELPFVTPSLDPSVLREHLAIGYAVAPRTLFSGVKKLPPATKLVWERETGARLERYWQMPAEVQGDLTEERAIELVRTELERAVEEHMVSDVPIGAFLSGGIDSSAVVALMAKHSSGPVNTYSIGYAGSAAASYYNELSYAAAVARRFKTKHTEIPVEPNVVALLPKLIWHVEEPISDSAIVTTYLVSELAARSVKVILSGVGGDELFAGYTRYLGDHYNNRYRRLPAWLRQNILRPLAQALPSGRQSRMLDLARYARRFIAASEMPWRERYRFYMEICGAEQLETLLAGSSGPDGFDLAARDEHATDPLLRLFRVDASTQLAEDLLLLTDKVTMATSIECRVPFLDHRLVELAARIPAKVKMRGGKLKYLLKRSLEDLLPQEILYRGKRGFGAPMGAWFKSELKGLCDELLSPRAVAARGLLGVTAVREVMARHDAQREDYTDLLLVLVNLEIWCRLFLDRRSASDVGAELSELTLAA